MKHLDQVLKSAYPSHQIDISGPVKVSICPLETGFSRADIEEHPRNEAPPMRRFTFSGTCSATDDGG